MPLDEEGAKWSCEPCIRGHRSSKCRHFDRLMMKVPKAGRPLAKCPHPKGSCSCQKLYAFMVRIPKGSGCLCRPVYQVPAGADPASVTLPSISSATSKVQKSGKKANGIQAAPQNIAKAFNMESEYGNGEVVLSSSSFASPQPSFPMDGRCNGISNLESMQNAFQAGPVNGKVETASQLHGCCSKVTKVAEPVQKEGSCCRKSTDTGHLTSVNNTPACGDSDHSLQAVLPNRPLSGNFSLSESSRTWGLHGNLLFTHAPVKQGGDRHVSAPNPSHATKHEPIDHVTASNSDEPHSHKFLALDEPTRLRYPSTLFTDSNGECNCGDGCQCLGCASHPFNDTTRQHVREMGALVALDSHAGLSDDWDFRSILQPGTTLDYIPNVLPPDHSHIYGDKATWTSPDPIDGRTSTDEAHTAQLAPPISEFDAGQQLMHPSEYYTLTYPVGLPGTCTDATGSCQCGSDCSCTGCLTHSGHMGVPSVGQAPRDSVANTSDDNEPSLGLWNNRFTEFLTSDALSAVSSPGPVATQAA